MSLSGYLRVCPGLPRLVSWVGFLGEASRRASVLLDDQVVGVALDDLLDAYRLMPTADDELRRVRARSLVNLARDSDLLRAQHVTALADDPELATDLAQKLRSDPQAAR
jgi:hypothetical protein